MELFECTEPEDVTLWKTNVQWRNSMIRKHSLQWKDAETLDGYMCYLKNHKGELAGVVHITDENRVSCLGCRDCAMFFSRVFYAIR
jgi:hypothetical protein